MADKIISVSCLPLPTYVQSGHVIFNPGERHPNRNNFKFFVMIFMVRGTLYIAEDDEKYTVSEGEMFILLPRHHHYSWKPMDEVTEYYWVHFDVTGNFTQDREPEKLRSIIQVPSLHYYTPSVTMFLKKHEKLDVQDKAVPLVEKIFKYSGGIKNEPSIYGFWQAQQLFIDLLQQIQMQQPSQSPETVLASQIQSYLRDHFDEKITNSLLANTFHVSANLVVSSMKSTYGITPNLFLTQYRLEEAIKRLLTTDEQITDIAIDVGYQNVYYFSMVFKKYYGVSPLVYRKTYNNKE